MNYFLRKVNENDIDELAKIMKYAFSIEPWNECWDEKSCFDRLTLFNKIPSALNYVLVDENNSPCAAAFGYVVPFIDDIEYAFQDFFVNPQLKGNHLGTFFMNELLKKLKENNVTKIKFYTSGSLDKFYSKFGFHIIDNEYLMELKF